MLLIRKENGKSTKFTFFSFFFLNIGQKAFNSLVLEKKKKRCGKFFMVTAHTLGSATRPTSKSFFFYKFGSIYSLIYKLPTVGGLSLLSIVTIQKQSAYHKHPTFCSRLIIGWITEYGFHESCLEKKNSQTLFFKPPHRTPIEDKSKRYLPHHRVHIKK